MRRASAWALIVVGGLVGGLLLTVAAYAAMESSVVSAILDSPCDGLDPRPRVGAPTRAWTETVANGSVFAVEIPSGWHDLRITGHGAKVHESDAEGDWIRGSLDWIERGGGGGCHKDPHTRYYVANGEGTVDIALWAGDVRAPVVR